MKKILLLVVCAALTCVATSCGSKKVKPIEEAKVSAQDSILLAHVMLEVDSLFDLMRSKMPIAAIFDIKTGKLKVTEKEKKVKPDYLMPLSKADGLQTISQQSRALMIYTLDRTVAELYGLPTDGYDAVIAKLTAYLGLYNFSYALDMDWSSPTAKEDFVTRSREIAKTERDRGAERFLVERASALTIESIFLFSQNPTLFTNHLSDGDVVEITRRLYLLTQMVEKLISFYPEMTPLKSAFETLKKLDADSKKEFLEQLKSIAPAITKDRNSLLD